MRQTTKSDGGIAMTKKPVLVIMAAGMGSRFGGLKQLEPIDDNGNFIIDYSIYDAIRCGFDKVVFIIKKENYESFRETIGKRVENRIKTVYMRTARVSLFLCRGPTSSVMAQLRPIPAVS